MLGNDDLFAEIVARLEPAAQHTALDTRATLKQHSWMALRAVSRDWRDRAASLSVKKMLAPAPAPAPATRPAAVNLAPTGVAMPRQQLQNQPATRRWAQTVFHGHSKGICCVALAPTSARRVVSAALDGSVYLWDPSAVETPLLLQEKYAENGSAVGFLALSFATNGKHIVGAADDASLRVWQLPDSDKPVGPPLALKGHSGWVFAASFSPQGDQLVSGGADHTVRLWPLAAANNAAVKPLILRGHRAPVRNVSFSPCGTQVVSSGGLDCTVRVWDLNAPATPLILQHSASVRHVAFSPAGTHVVSSTRDRALHVWQLSNPAQSSMRLAHDAVFGAIAFSDDGTCVLGAALDGSVVVWPWRAPNTPLVLKLDDMGAFATALVGDALVHAKLDGKVYFYDRRA